MGWTSENVAEDFNVSRGDMDEFAARSFQRAESAQKAGHFAKEIVPFFVPQKDSATGELRNVLVDKDDGIRYETTKESLAKIRPAFPHWGGGKTTGGNASQITDGAAAVLLMTRRKAEELGLKIIAKHVTTAVAGAFVDTALDYFTNSGYRYRSPSNGYRSCICYPDGAEKCGNNR